MVLNPQNTWPNRQSTIWNHVPVGPTYWESPKDSLMPVKGNAVWQYHMEIGFLYCNGKESLIHVHMKTHLQNFFLHKYKERVHYLNKINKCICKGLIYFIYLFLLSHCGQLLFLARWLMNVDGVKWSRVRFWIPFNRIALIFVVLIIIQSVSSC